LAAVVETSPNNFEGWFNHGQVLEVATSTAKQLAERFKGDPSSADWGHFGRLAGFTNPKPERQLASGLRPFARLRSAKGRVYSRPAEFLAGIVKNDAATTMQESRSQRHRRTEGEGVKPLQDFHADPTYAGDLHRAGLVHLIELHHVGIVAALAAGFVGNIVSHLVDVAEKPVLCFAEAAIRQ
jgi:hypothetical protein